MKSIYTIIALSFLLVLTDTSFLGAQDMDLLEGLEFRSVGPSRGGRSTAITGVPTEPFTFYMGGTGSGVWRTTDAGTSWINIGDGQIDAGSIGAISVAPSDPNFIYVGTGSACPRGNVSPGIGIYRSTDKGKTWEHAGLPDAGQIAKVEIHPTNPDIAYVAALGNIFGPNSQRGIFRTKDGGSSWQKVLFVSDSTGAVDVIMDPSNPRILFAAMWRAERKPWTMIDGGMEGGIWKSVDGGDNWKKLDNGLPRGLIGRIGLTISPANPNRLWAQIQTNIEKDGGLYRSDDSGKSWTKINRHHKLRQRGWYYSHITADPQDPNVIYASNTGFYKSIDGGKTFDRIGTPHGDNHGVWINPNNTQIMINCNDGGANVSLNGGDTWSTQLNQPTSEFYRVSVDNQFPYNLYAGQQDNTTISVPSGYLPSVTPFQHWKAVGGGESGDVAVDPRNSNIVYAGTYSGEITYLDLSNDYIQQMTAYPHYTEGTEQRDLKYRWQWNFPISINPRNPDEVFHTSNYVHKSTDKGKNWTVISPDLTRSIDAYHGIPGGPVQHDGTGVEIYSTIFAFEISPIEEGVMWSGSDDGMIYITKDAGKKWENITQNIIPKEGTVNKIYLSRHQKGTAYVAVYHYRHADYKPYIIKISDYGKSWKLLTNGKNGIPSNHFVRTVIEDNNVQGILYAGTEFGAYISYDDGSNWKPFQLNLPVVPITDMEWIDNSIAMSTQGRAFWVLDDLNPVQELPEINKSSNYLFTPANAYRTTVYGKGLSIKYFLGMEDQKVTISVKSGDKVMKSFSTEPGDGEEKLSVDKGLNTLYWDLRTQGPEIVPDFVSMVMSSREKGPYIPTGDYTLEITSGDFVMEKPFKVILDPRWNHVTQEDLDSQYELAIEIMDMIQESQDLIREVRSIREQSTDLAKRAKEAGYSDELQESASALSKAITAVEDNIIQNQIETSQDAINYPRKFSNHIGRLYGVLVRNHGAPTGGVKERFEDVKLEHKVNLSAYEKVKNSELADFLQLIKDENVSPIILPGKK